MDAPSPATASHPASIAFLIVFPVALIFFSLLSPKRRSRRHRSLTRCAPTASTMAGTVDRVEERCVPPPAATTGPRLRTHPTTPLGILRRHRGTGADRPRKPRPALDPERLGCPTPRVLRAGSCVSPTCGTVCQSLPIPTQSRRGRRPVAAKGELPEAARPRGGAAASSAR